MIGQRVLTRFDWLQLYSEERKKVALVLGVEDEHHETGIKYLEQLAPLLSSACGNQWSKQSHSEFKGLLKEILRTDGLAALKDLFGHPWWQRAWTVQEAVPCANTTILIGQNSLNFTVMDQVVGCTDLIEETFLELGATQSLGSIPGWRSAMVMARTRREFYNGQRLTLLVLLHGFLGQKWLVLLTVLPRCFVYCQQRARPYEPNCVSLCDQRYLLTNKPYKGILTF